MALSWMEEEGRVVGVEFGVDGRKDGSPRYVP